jgi:predicted PurR-regulated permease PerM
MNFDNDVIMPKLIDKKIINYYKSKIKQQELLKTINNEKQIINQETFISKCCKILIDNTKSVLINYYGFILLILTISILLYLRYKEVNKKKKYINKIIKKYNI